MIDFYKIFEAVILCLGLVAFTAVIGLMLRGSVGVLGQMTEVIMGIITGDLHYDPQVAEARKQDDPHQSKWSVNDLIHLKNGLMLLQMLSDNVDPTDDIEDDLDEQSESDLDK